MNAHALLIVIFALGAQQGYGAAENHKSPSAVEEQQVGLFYGLGSSFRVSQLISLVPRRVRTMATCVQRVGSGHDMREMRDEMNYIVDILQKNPATGKVMFELEMIYTNTVQALTAIPTVVMTPPAELSFDEVMILTEAAFNLMALPVRLGSLRSSIAAMFLSNELYDRELANELGRHFVAQLRIAADLGSAVLRCRSDELAGIAQIAISTLTLDAATTPTYDDRTTDITDASTTIDTQV